jgi:hypothetical protein
MGQSDTIYCHQCGYANGSWRSTCENCSTQLFKVETAATQQRKRPLGVTLYIGYIVVVTSLVMFASLGNVSFLYYGLWIGVLVSAVGVWQMKSWGRTAFLMMATIGLIVDVIDLTTYASAFGGSVLIGYFVGLSIRLAFMYWLATNSQRFED